MTIKLHIFGNSHLAAVKDGFEQFDGRWPELDATFVGAHKDGLAEVACENGILTPLSENAVEDFDRLAGLSSVDLTSAEAIIIVGAGFSPVRAAMLYHRARFAALPSVQAKPDPSPDWVLVSEHAFSEMLQATLMDEVAGRLVRIIKRDIDVPVFVVSQPRTTTRIMDIGKHRLDIVRKAVVSGDGPALSAIYENAAKAAAAALDVTYIPQMPQTIAQDMLTAEPYSKGAIRLAKLGRFSQPKEDVLHTNAAYGKIVLDQIRSALVREKLLAP